jgi:hypothetical protein
MSVCVIMVSYDTTKIYTHTQTPILSPPTHQPPHNTRPHCTGGTMLRLLLRHAVPELPALEPARAQVCAPGHWWWARGDGLFAVDGPNGGYGGYGWVFVFFFWGGGFCACLCVCVCVWIRILGWTHSTPTCDLWVGIYLFIYLLIHDMQQQQQQQQRQQRQQQQQQQQTGAADLPYRPPGQAAAPRHARRHRRHWCVWVSASVCIVYSGSIDQCACVCAGGG